MEERGLQTELELASQLGEINREASTLLNRAGFSQLDLWVL
jgi:hypothetical protein